jgi:hypothetical protein
VEERRGKEMDGCPLTRSLPRHILLQVTVRGTPLDLSLFIFLTLSSPLYILYSLSLPLLLPSSILLVVLVATITIIVSVT